MPKLSHLVAGNRFVGLAVFPIRTGGLAPIDAEVVKQSAYWLVISREHTSFTSGLTSRNDDHLGWRLALIIECRVDAIRAFLQERAEDHSLRECVRAVIAEAHEDDWPAGERIGVV